MGKTGRIVLEFILAIGCLIFIILFVLQIQNTEQAKDDLQLSQLEGTGEALRAGMAETQAAEDIGNAQATATQAAQDAAATQTQLLAELETTITQSASDLSSLQGTATQSMNFIQATEFVLVQEFAQINATAAQAGRDYNQAQTQVAIHQEELAQLNETIQDQATEIAFYLSDASNRIDGSQTLVTDKYELILPDGFVGYDLIGGGTEKAVEAMTALGPAYEGASFLAQSGPYSAIGLPITNRFFELMIILEFPVLVSLSEFENMIPEILEGYQISYDTYVAQIYTANSEVDGLVFNQNTLRIRVDDIKGYYNVFYIMSDNTTTYQFWYMSEELLGESRIAEIDEVIGQNLTFNN